MILWLDTETRSPIPIRYGVRKYASQAAVILLQWAVDHGIVHVDEPLCAAPRDLREFFDAVAAADEIWCHNTEFDRTVLEAQPWFKRVHPRKWRCTATLARAHGLPGGLDKLCGIFHLPQDKAKDKRGHELIQLFCVPGFDGKFAQPKDHPKEWAEFKSYGAQDIVAMREIYRVCPKWNSTARLWEQWRVDYDTNFRGIAVDIDFAAQAVGVTTRAKRGLAATVSAITEGEVGSATQVAKLRAFLADTGIDLPDLKADTVERRLEDESLPEYAKELLRTRQQASKSSTAKYQRVLNAHHQGRLHNLLLLCGAQRTGRYAGRMFQPQNLPRPKHSREDIEGFIAYCTAGAADLYTTTDTMGLASSALRGLLIAGPGKKLLVADLANIEGRVMAWLAGEDWKLDAFRAYDKGRGPDLYKLSYARAFNIDPRTIGDDDPRRQIGKVMELALQYYGGVGAFLSMAVTYGLDLEKLAEAAWPVLPAWAVAKSREQYQSPRVQKRVWGVSPRVWLVCNSLVLMWRRAHPAIVQLWYDLDEAVKIALRMPGKTFHAGRLDVDRRGNWLRIRLPSGRYLSYPAPRDRSDSGLSFVGVNPYTRQWARLPTYSGKLAENATQGAAADILLDGLVRASFEGYPPVLSVHDELLCEVPNSPEYTVDALVECMTTSSPWAEGLPLAAKGFETSRYRK